MLVSAEALCPNYLLEASSANLRSETRAATTTALSPPDRCVSGIRQTASSPETEDRHMLDGCDPVAPPASTGPSRLIGNTRAAVREVGINLISAMATVCLHRGASRRDLSSNERAMLTFFLALALHEFTHQVRTRQPVA